MLDTFVMRRDAKLLARFLSFNAKYNNPIGFWNRKPKSESVIHKFHISLCLNNNNELTLKPFLNRWPRRSFLIESMWSSAPLLNLLLLVLLFASVHATRNWWFTLIISIGKAWYFEGKTFSRRKCQCRWTEHTTVAICMRNNEYNLIAMRVLMLHQVKVSSKFNLEIA